VSIVREFESAFNRLLQLGFAPEALAKVLRRRLPASV
jgi:hypothetical protein